MAQKKEIEVLMETVISNIKDLLQVNMVVGNPISVGSDTTIIPISKISCGFVAGGGEYGKECKGKKAQSQGDAPFPNAEENEFPFGGGSGAGVSVKPVGFLAVENGKVRLISVDSVLPMERLIDAAPGLIQQVEGIVQKYKPIVSGSVEEDRSSTKDNSLQ